MVPVFELVSYLTGSERRMTMLFVLAEEPITRQQLHGKTGIQRASIEKILAEFQQRNLATDDGHLFTATALGRHVAGELRSSIESIEAMRVIEPLRAWLPVEEIGLPVRRLDPTDVYHASPEDTEEMLEQAQALVAEATRMRSLVHFMVPPCLDAAWRSATDGRQTLEGITTTEVLEGVNADQTQARQVRDLFMSQHAEGFVYDGEIPQEVLILDTTVFLPVLDDEGRCHGYIESEDVVIREWAEELIDSYKRIAEPVEANVIAP